MIVVDTSAVVAAHGGVHDLRLYLHEAGVEIVPVDRDQADTALRAWTRFGQGRHPAGLNHRPSALLRNSRARTSAR